MSVFLKSLLPGHTPPNILKAGRFTALQERILQWILLVILAIGALAFAGVVLTAGKIRLDTTLIMAIILYACTLAIAILRTKPYPIRAGLMLALLFFMNVQLVLKSDLTLGALPFFFVCIFLAGLFFGSEVAAVVFGLGMAVGVTTMFLPGSPWKTLLDTALAGKAPTETIISIIAFACSGGLAILAVTLMNRELNRSVRSEIESREHLELETQAIDARIRENTAIYQRRLQESLTAAEISRSFSSILNPDQLLQSAVDLVQQRFKLYYIGIFVLDAEQRFAVLRAGSGEAGRKMLADGHRLPVSGTSMIGWVTINKKARIALDIGQDAVRFNNPNLPFTRSEMALPMVANDQVLGAMTVQSNQPNAFQDDDIRILQGVADSLAIALENARLYHQTQEMLEEIRQMNQEYLEKAWQETLRISGGLQFNYDNSGETTTPRAETKIHQYPLILRDQVIGTISLESDHDQLSPEDNALIEAVASQTAVALDNARLLQESQRHAYEEQKLNDLSRQFTEAGSVEDILRIAVRELGDLPSAAEVSIHLVTPAEVEHSSNGGNGWVKENLG